VTWWTWSDEIGLDWDWEWMSPEKSTVFSGEKPDIFGLFFGKIIGQ
jgi:hypothetical protein